MMIETQTQIEARFQGKVVLPRIRAHVWLSAAELGQNDAYSRLWLHLADGQVRVFRLPAAKLGHQAALALLVDAAAADPRGLLLELNDPAFDWAIPVYAAPAVPFANPQRWGVAHAQAQRFAAGLDAEVLQVLGQLDRQRTWGSARNYTRLATLPPVQRTYRLQAISRFPVLVAPVLLSAHHRLELDGGKRHAWREHDDAVIEAIDRGHDLTGALAACYGISRALVRSAVCRSMWGSTSLTHRNFLLLLDAMTPEQRPASWEEIEPFVPNLPALSGLLGEQDRFVVLGREVFRPGWTKLWRACAQRFEPLPSALFDTGDFLRAATAQAAATPGAGAWNSSRLALAWMRSRGLVSLLNASRRWHAAYRARIDPQQSTEVLPRVLEPQDTAAGSAREIDDRPGLVLEGEEMGHCVADYWTDCLIHGHRIVSLRGPDGERATAQYQPSPTAADATSYRLVQLRGLENDETSEAMDAWADLVEVKVNAVVRRSCRVAALAAARARALGQGDAPLPAAHVPLDRESARELARVLARHAAQPENRPLPGEVLRARVAGFGHHGGAAIEAQLKPGCALALVREPLNPHDTMAVRIDGCAVTLGYVPRPINADIARRLDAGEALACQVIECDPNAEPWKRLVFAITLECDRPSSAEP